MRPPFLVTLVLFASAGVASATTIDVRPRPAALLAGGRFVAQCGSASIGLYDAAGNPVYQFAVVTGGQVGHLALTADERRLAVACTDGAVAVADLQTGAILWSLSAAQTGLGHVYDLSLSWDGKSMVASGYWGRAQVYDTATGAPVRAVAFPPNQTGVMSTALSPDGTVGVLVELGGKVYAFDVATGAMRDTGVTGAWPVRYAADGRHFALRSDNSDTREHLRVVLAADPADRSDLGEFRHIGHLRATPDGGFLVTAAVREEDRSSSVVTGAVWEPGTRQVRTVWRSAGQQVGHGCGDFDPDQGLAVVTDYRLVTRVSDVRTDATKLTVDNSANYRPAVTSWSVNGGPSRSRTPYVLGCAVLAGSLLLAVIVAYRFRRRRLAARSNVRGFPLASRDAG